MHAITGLEHQKPRTRQVLGEAKSQKLPLAIGDSKAYA